MTMTLIELFRLPSSGIIHQYHYVVFRQGQHENRANGYRGHHVFWSEPSSFDSSPFYEMFMYLIANLSQIPIKDIDTYLSRKKFIQQI